MMVMPYTANAAKQLMAEKVSGASRLPPERRTAHPLVRQLGREHIEVFEDRCCGEQVRRVLAERRRNTARQMGAPSGFIGERVENPKRRRCEPDGKPDKGLWLRLYKRGASVQKRFQIRFAAWFGLQAHP